jgi:radical SAM superfamily enzyme YgiQ (UPF0313 family)
MGRNKTTAQSNPLQDEQGTIRKQSGAMVALGYPAPYRVAASSLGLQTVYRTFNMVNGLSCARFFPPREGPVVRPLRVAESNRPVSDARAIAFSVACETELAVVAQLISAADLEPLAINRGRASPPVVIGGPLTFLDPHLVSGLADIVVPGEAETALVPLGEAIAICNSKEELLERAQTISGTWIPARQPDPPPQSFAPMDLLPATAATWSPHAEFKDLFLVEAARGCPRGCAFCVMSRRAGCKSKFRQVPMDRVLNCIPMEAKGVGLVGAAVTDHKQIEAMVNEIVNRGQRVSLSSIRADRLTENLARTLQRGGLQTLTVAADGSSERTRRSIDKGITAENLISAAKIARTVGLRGMKLYSMIGLPGETDADIKEFVELTLQLASIIRLTVAVQSFVPKPATPLAAVPMEDLTVLKKRLETLRKQLHKKVRLMPTSPRWSWVDWKLAHAGEKAARIAIEVGPENTEFGAWRRAIKKII